MCIYIQRFFALGKGLDRQCCTVLDENCCRPGVVEESQQQGPGLGRPKTAQKPAQPNEPSLWVRVWLGHFLGYFWFSNPDPKVYRISEPETNTKSETNFEQDLPPAVAPLSLAMDTPTAPPPAGVAATSHASAMASPTAFASDPLY